MIELLDRQEIFKLNKIFASFIIEVQEVQYNPMLVFNKYFPELMWVDTGFTADICKYGNIHFHFYSSKDKRNITKVAKAIGMIKVKDGQCFENFSEVNAIKGRQILIR